jgi:hypothetical protein
MGVPREESLSCRTKLPRTRTPKALSGPQAARNLPRGQSRMMSLASSPSPILPKVAAQVRQPTRPLGAAPAVRAQLHALKGQQPATPALSKAAPAKGKLPSTPATAPERQ